MKKIIVIIVTLFALQFNINAQKVAYKVITSIESIDPAGLGRSRIISANDERDYEAYTSTQTKNNNTINKSKRKKMRVKGYDETKLLNFFNLGGIRFQNIATNDAIITSKINKMIELGWELAFVSTGVESSAGDDDDEGIFITRYIFKRLRKL